MGSACCVPVKDKTVLPSTTAGQGRSYSPTWNCSWDNHCRLEIELENPHECSGLLERPSQGDFQMPVRENSPTHQLPAVNSLASGSEPSMGSSSFKEDAHLVEPSEIADSSVSRLQFSIPLSSSPCSMSNGDLSLQRCSLPVASTSSWQACHSPGYHLQRQISDVRQSDLRSPNYSISEGSPSIILSTCSNDLTVGSQGGRSSDGWSMSTFSELVTSQKERWSFDCENLDCAHGKVARSNSRFLVSPSIDLRTCGVCLKLLIEKSPWVAQKITFSNELSVVAVLVCGHVYHAECLENRTPETYRFDPPCPVCTTGDKQALKIYGKNVKIDTDSKVMNKISRNRVVDSNINFDHTVPDQWRGTRREGKNPILGSSSSMKSSLAKPFLRRHFSLGSKSTKSILQEFRIKSPSKKGFWSKYRTG